MKRLNEILQELGISKVRLAKYLGVSRQMVYNYLELVCSKKADVTDILTEYSDAAAGSICYCIESKTRYMLNPERTAWMPITNTDTED